MNQRIIENPIGGDSIEFIKTREETNGEYLEFIQTMNRYRGGEIPEHVHPDFDETFEVVEGTALYSINGVEGKAEVGDKIIIPANTKHVNPFNMEKDKSLVVHRVITPEKGVEHYYRKVCQLVQEGHLDRNGKIDKIRFSVLVKNTESKTYFTTSPRWIQRFGYHFFGTIGELIGYSHKL